MTYKAHKQDNTYKIWRSEPTRYYYKYQYTPYVRPNLTSDTGNPDLKVGAYGLSRHGPYPFSAFDGNSGTQAHGYRDGGGLYEIYFNMEFGTSINITGFNMSVWAGENNSWGHYDFIVYGSNVSVDSGLVQLHETGWITWGGTANFTFSNNNYYKFYRIRFIVGGSYDHDEAGAFEIYPVGTIKTIVVGTSTDYDFYQDVYTYKGVK